MTLRQVEYYTDIREHYVCTGSLMHLLRVGKAMVDWLKKQNLEEYCWVKLITYLDAGDNELIIDPDPRLPDKPLRMIRGQLKELTKDMPWKLITDEVKNKIISLALMKEKE